MKSFHLILFIFLHSICSAVTEKVLAEERVPGEINIFVCIIKDTSNVYCFQMYKSNGGEKKVNIITSISLPEISKQVSGDFNWTWLTHEFEPANILFHDKNLGFIYGSGTFGEYQEHNYFLRTEDGGKNWALISSSPFNTEYDKFFMFHQYRGIIVSHPGTVYAITSDGGKTWETKKIKGAPYGCYFTVFTGSYGQVTIVVRSSRPYRMDCAIKYEEDISVFESKNYGETFKKLK